MKFCPVSLDEYLCGQNSVQSVSAVFASVSSFCVYLMFQAADWNKYDARLLKAVESGDVDKVSSTLKKGAVATKLDADGRCS